VIPKVHTTLMPIDTPDDPKPRAELAFYCGDEKVATILREYDEPLRCDRCGELLEVQVEHEVDEDGVRHVEDPCPPPRVVTVEVPDDATEDEVKAAIEEAQAGE
jgi:hypothetical protein